MTLVCVPIMVHDVEQALADARAAKAGGADLVEFRIDEFYAGDGTDDAALPVPVVLEHLTTILQDSPLACIVTCRSAREGGSYAGSEAGLVRLIEHLATMQPHAPRFIDVEFATVQRSPAVRAALAEAIKSIARRQPDMPTRLIVSMHDFESPPLDLARRVDAMQRASEAGVVKVACRARNVLDAIDTLELPAQMDKPAIALAMGDFGLASRVLAPKFGGILTFASLRRASVTAPGQPTLEELFDVYRLQRIGRRTRVYGVVGFPLTHSRSPLAHNAVFAEAGIDAVYVPLPIAEYPADPVASYAGFRAMMLEMLEHDRLDLHGCSVTMPHKEHLVRLALEQGWELDAVSRALGVANTIAIERANGRCGSVRIANTDVAGVTAPLESALGTLAGKRVAVVGAGGGARAAAYAALSRGAIVSIHARRAEQAKRCADSLAPCAPPRERWAISAHTPSDLVALDVDAVVHCTPVGMVGSGQEHACIVPIDAMRPRAAPPIVFDTVYNPIDTPLLKLARARGWRTIDGVAMFIEQAALQAETWHPSVLEAASLRRLIDACVRNSLRGSPRETHS